MCGVPSVTCTLCHSFAWNYDFLFCEFVIYRMKFRSKLHLMFLHVSFTGMLPLYNISLTRLFE